MAEGTGKLLHKWVCDYGSVEYLAHVKKTRKYDEFLMELDKNIMQTWASNEWGHELSSIKLFKLRCKQL